MFFPFGAALLPPASLDRYQGKVREVELPGLVAQAVALSDYWMLPK